MKIRIDDNFGIKSDSLNYTLCKIKKYEHEGEDENECVYEEGKETWLPYRYYNNLDQALTGYKKHSLMTADNIESFAGVIEKLEEIEEVLSDIREELRGA